MAPLNVRAQSATLLKELVSGKGSLTSLLARQRQRQDYALLQELCFGLCRWWFALEALVQALLSKPLRSKDRDLQILLMAGIYQLRELALPEYAVINETVNAASQLKKPWAKGLINGVLRNYQRNREAFETRLDQGSPDIACSFPHWLYQAISADWPERSNSLFVHANKRPPMSLRTNLQKISRSALLARFEAEAMGSEPGLLADTSIILAKPTPVAFIPGFESGQVSVQDEASQLVPGLLDLQPGHRVLDACAAPGGKTCAILEQMPSLSGLVALDVDAARLEKLQENLDRLQLYAETRVTDAARPEQWWDRRLFDRILIDAPCSGTGVIRRHPDIKLLRRESDLPALISGQLELLHALWPTLAPGGLLLYTSCSILRGENEKVIEQFLGTTHNAKYEGITADWGVECRFGRQLLTDSSNGPDGFFYALLRKS